MMCSTSITPFFSCPDDAMRCASTKCPLCFYNFILQGERAGQNLFAFSLNWMINRGGSYEGLNTIAMINWPDCWKEEEWRTNWFLRIIRTLEKFQLWDEVKNRCSGYKNIKNSFHLLCMPSLIYEQCVCSRASFCAEKLLHNPIIYHIPKKNMEETISVVVAQATNRHQSRIPKNFYELKSFFLPSDDMRNV